MEYILTNIREFLVQTVIKNDKSGQYKYCLIKQSSKTQDVDETVKEAIRILSDTGTQVDFLLKQASFEKDASFIMKVILKTLKIAQKMLAALIFKSPLRVGIAYNAIHLVIKHFETKMKTEKIKEKKQ